MDKYEVRDGRYNDGSFYINAEKGFSVQAAGWGFMLPVFSFFILYAMLDPQVKTIRDRVYRNKIFSLMASNVAGSALLIALMAADLS